MKYSGIDLHSNNSVVTVTDDADRVVAEKRLPNDAKDFRVSRAVESGTRRCRGRVDLQLLLACRWAASLRLHRPSGEHHGDQEIRWA
jgi:hypothetical protein